MRALSCFRLSRESGTPKQMPKLPLPMQRSMNALLAAHADSTQPLTKSSRQLRCWAGLIACDAGSNAAWAMIARARIAATRLAEAARLGASAAGSKAAQAKSACARHAKARLAKAARILSRRELKASQGSHRFPKWNAFGQAPAFRPTRASTPLGAEFQTLVCATAMGGGRQRGTTMLLVRSNRPEASLGQKPPSSFCGHGSS